jgi:hypothetical protein
MRARGQAEAEDVRAFMDRADETTEADIACS